MATRLLLLLPIVALLAGGCQFPRDTRGTLDRVEGGVVRVGVTESEPWVTTGEGRPEGVEIELIDGFARTLDARVEFTTGSEEELIGALHEGALDLVAGGMTKRSQWKEASPTRQFATTRLVLGLPVGAPDDPAVDAVERGSEAAGLAERTLDARIAPVEALPRGRPAVVDDWLLDDLGLRAGRELRTSKHVMFVRMGENAFQVELERYLHARGGEVARLLEEQGRP